MRGKPGTRLLKAEWFGGHEVLGFSTLEYWLVFHFFWVVLNGSSVAFYCFLKGHHDGTALTRPVDGQGVKGGGAGRASSGQRRFGWSCRRVKAEDVSSCQLLIYHQLSTRDRGPRL